MEIPVRFETSQNTFDPVYYEKKFKALADEKRLTLLNELCVRGQTCVCDLTDILNIPQSKLSYHIKILLDAGFIEREKKGQWNYYRLKEETMNEILSEKLCCILRPSE
ncbi:arsenical resistance operon repressor [Halalkalibacter wakoensis JCM 9140]|uniref:Arsenical resistance operon repressor n=1 Tax=Halalkalibacter wakoensis JCM 9140 TaxID=1236970 RepID=W4Q6S0_9BACI|nr:metalloregulator ArsR/SmtB family transcription factor [Halalkalibacter wakoensis]GAE27697.1 arsenical resistance operon repressor [Halalkalibacter wakoensis JCM 9140]